jgi:plastocyanin
MISLIGFSCLWQWKAILRTRKMDQAKMNAKAQRRKNQPAPRRETRFSRPRVRLLWLVVLLLATAGTALPATFEVGVGDGGPAFTPGDLTIHAGDTVQWYWGDPEFSHTVTSGKNGKADGLFDSSGHRAPFTFSFTFTDVGTFDYFCRFHFDMGMVGVIHVVPGTASAAQPLNISTRLRVQTGENVMIGGFIITGSVPKKVIIRAIGPSLADAGVQDPLADPTLELHDANSTLDTNDNWKTRSDGTSQQAEIEATTVPPKNDLESAILRTLPANNAAYTVIVSGKNGGTGVGVVEVYDLDQPADSRLANISTRGLVQTGGNVMIGGFILGGGSGNMNVIVRAIGPSLTAAGIKGALADPTLELRDGNGALMRSNNDWKTRPDGSSQQAEIEATGVAPKNDLESAIAANLPPGTYTAIVAGTNSTTGVGVVEVYRLP